MIALLSWIYTLSPYQLRSVYLSSIALTTVVIETLRGPPLGRFMWGAYAARTLAITGLAYILATSEWNKSKVYF